MVNSISTILKRGRFAVAGMLFALSVVTAGAATISNPSTAKAAACDPVNIVYCGLNGSNLNTAINSFQADYNNGSNNGHTDLKAVYRWAGATDNSVAAMNSNNTKLGTLYRNGDIKVNGTLVGHDAWVSARFGAGQAGFEHVEGDVWARKTTTSFAEASAPVIVHMDNNGNADFAVMIGCGNAVKFPPVVQQHPMLSCDNLTKDKITDRKFHFSASASAKDTNITKYVFDFGDGNSDTVRTNNKQATTSHSYDKFDHDYKVRVTVYSSDFQGGKTGSNCVLTVHTSAQPVQPALVCDDLRANNSGLKYTFYATATATNATIKSYTFHFSDGTTATTVATSAQRAVLKHTFTKYNTQETVYVTVKASDNLQTARTARCTLKFTTPKQKECKPGIPVGDQRCSECQPSGQMNACVPPTPQAPKELAKTGPAGMIGLFGGTSTLGALVHRLILRRKLGL